LNVKPVPTRPHKTNYRWLTLGEGKRMKTCAPAPDLQELNP